MVALEWICLTVEWFVCLLLCSFKCVHVNVSPTYIIQRQLQWQTFGKMLFLFPAGSLSEATTAPPLWQRHNCVSQTENQRSNDTRGQVKLTTTRSGVVHSWLKSRWWITWRLKTPLLHYYSDCSIHHSVGSTLQYAWVRLTSKQSVLDNFAKIVSCLQPVRTSANCWRSYKNKIQDVNYPFTLQEGNLFIYLSLTKFDFKDYFVNFCVIALS